MGTPPVPGAIDVLARQEVEDGPIELVFRRFVAVPGQERLQEEVADPLVFRPIHPDECVGQPTATVEADALRWLAGRLG